MKKKQILKKPNIFAYGIFHYGCKLWAKLKYNLKVIRNETKGVKKPFVVIANHESSIDVVTLSGALRRRSHFIISNSFYNSLGFRWALDACGLIPKQQFQTNGSDMKKMKAALTINKMPLVLYPAGMMSENGETTPIPLATGRVLRWFNHDIYVAKVEGTYLTKPKWSKKLRRGKTTLSIYKLIDAEQLNQMKDEDIQKLIEEHLYFNAYENQEKNMVEYQDGDNLEGIQNVLYQCLSCGSKYTLEVKNNNQLICSKCGNGAQGDKFGFLHKIKEDDIIYRHPLDWSKRIYQNLEETIKEDDNYMLSSQVKIKMLSYKKEKYVDVGEGYLTLNKEKFNLKGTIKGEEVNLDFPVSQFPILPFKPGMDFDLQLSMNIYRIVLNEPSHTVEWINTLKYFHNKSLEPSN